MVLLVKSLARVTHPAPATRERVDVFYYDSNFVENYEANSIIRKINDTCYSNFYYVCKFFSRSSTQDLSRPEGRLLVHYTF